MKILRSTLIGLTVYVLVTAALYVVAAAYIRSIGDLGAIPKVVWLLFGPALGLGSGHGIAAYAAATAVIVPLLVVALITKKIWKLICVAAAIGIWVGIGWFMA